MPWGSRKVDTTTNGGEDQAWRHLQRRTETCLRVRSDLPGSNVGTIFVSVPGLIFICDHDHLLLALLPDGTVHPIT